MRVFIETAYNSVSIYSEELTEGIDYLNRPFTKRSRIDQAYLKIDHDLRENSVLKYLENSRIVGLGRGTRGILEIEIENGDKLTQLEHMLKVSLIYPEVKNVLKGYSEGELTLDDAYVQLLPYVVAKSLVKS